MAVVAAVAVSVAALTAGGTSGAGGTNRVAAASADRTTVSAPADTTTGPPTVATTVPAPTADTAPAAAEATPPVTAESVAPQAEVAPAPVVQSTFTVSGSVSGVPAGSSATLTFTGPGGSFTVSADGGYSVSGLTAGDYTVVGQYTDTATGTATRAQKFGTVSVTTDSSASFTFS
jgi:nucleoid-associated protein YgaU